MLKISIIELLQRLFISMCMVFRIKKWYTNMLIEPKKLYRIEIFPIEHARCPNCNRAPCLTGLTAQKFHQAIGLIEKQLDGVLCEKCEHETITTDWYMVSVMDAGVAFVTGCHKDWIKEEVQVVDLDLYWHRN